jgi:hypothetical protein
VRTVGPVSSMYGITKLTSNRTARPKEHRSAQARCDPIYHDRGEARATPARGGRRGHGCVTRPRLQATYVVSRRTGRWFLPSEEAGWSAALDTPQAGASTGAGEENRVQSNVLYV